ncbi:MAG: LON peptidase substrate-binding domain-containing protein [Rhodospirillales bacterium]|nr:LON peptidase substrate-binding domain-containing protein [Rhodospirillales bacterium]
MSVLTATSHGSLPETLPIFPLSGVVLLPGGNLPLYIFEPRYKNMIKDAQKGDNMIGMVQPRAAKMEPVPEGIEIYDIGCVGEISRCIVLDDGGFEIILTGICRFEVKEEIAGIKGYRRVTADYDRFKGDLLEEQDSIAARQELVKALQGYLEANEIDAEMEDVARLPDQALVNALCTALPLELREKQALLEAVDLASRAQLLHTLLKMAASPFINDQSDFQN